MPASRDPLRGSPPELATGGARVNFDKAPEIVQDACSSGVSSDAAPPARTPYSPHWKLAARLHELRDLSDKAVRALTVLLWGAGKRGHGQGCGPGEAMLWRNLGGLAEAMGIAPGVKPNRSNTGSVRRALAELRERKLVRWVRVGMDEQRPDPGGTGDVFTGPKSRRGCCVYYVHLGAIWTRLGRPELATERTISDDGIKPESVINHDHAARSAPENRGPVTIQENAGTPVASVVNQISSLKTTTTGSQTTVEPHPPAPDGCGLGGPSENETDDARFIVSEGFAHWHARIGYRHARHVHGTTRAALTRAVAAGLTLDEIVDVVDGASDRELGGDSFDYCERKKIFGAGLFWSDQGRVSGCVAQLLERVPANRERRRRETERRERTRATEAPGWEEPRAPFALTPELCSKRYAIRLAIITKAHAEGRCEYCRLGYAEPADASRAAER
jgi:hypothetical protein